MLKAVRLKNLEIVKVLLDKGAKVSACDKVNGENNMLKIFF